MLRVFLFGTPRIEQRGQPVCLRRSRALALLAYLALTRQPQERDALLALIWPEFDEASARNNLRRELSLLKTALGEELIVADRRTVAWNRKVETWIDVVAFEEAVAAHSRHNHRADEACADCIEALSAAVPLVSDELLSGFHLPASPVFDDWLFFQREELRQQLGAALQVVKNWHVRQGAYDQALAYARRWLSLDLLHEPAQREVMQLYAWTGQQTAALRQYEGCVRLLEAELGAEPEAETTALYAAIKARRLEIPTRRSTSVAVPDATVGINQPSEVPCRALPQMAGFVGRQRELADVIRRLTDTGCRLLTLVGPGGVGKTRLALEVARILSEAWVDADEIADGVLFVSLAHVTTTNELVPALAGAAHFDFYPGASPQRQLIDFFRAKRMLLILDNAEQIGDGVSFLDQLLQSAPHLRLLVTSRVALNIQAEWFHPIDGMSSPSPEEEITSVAQLARFDAVKLFEQHARRVRSDFSLSRERAAVIHLCRLVGGMPLALELAATWLKALTVQQICAELEQSLDILTTRERSAPDRHRSMRHVLQGSWQLLSAREQQLFARLAVYNGSFSAEAAHTITGASLRELMGLVEQSLVYSTAGGRFSMNQLLRQFASEQLSAMPDEEARTRHAHATYYLHWVGAQRDALIGAGQQQALYEIALEYSNVCEAWRYAAACNDASLIHHAGHSIALYYIFRGPYQVGASALEQAIHSLRMSGKTELCNQALAGLFVDLAWLYLRLGRLAEAKTVLEESEALYTALGLPPAAGRATDSMLVLADLAMIAGDYVQAAHYGEIARRRNEAHNHLHNMPYVWYALTEVALAQGKYDLAQYNVQQAYNAVRRSGDCWYEAYIHSELGHVALAQGRYVEARQHYGASYALREAFGDPQGMAEALGHIARVALLQEQYGEAAHIYERICTMYERTGDRGGLARAMNGLGLAVCRLGEYAAARHYLRQAYTIAAELRFVPLLLTVMINTAELLCCEGQYERAATLLMNIRARCSSDRTLDEPCQRLLLHIKRELAPAPFTAAVARGEAGDLDTANATTHAALADTIDISAVQTTTAVPIRTLAAVSPSVVA